MGVIMEVTAVVVMMAVEETSKLVEPERLSSQ